MHKKVEQTMALLKKKNHDKKQMKAIVISGAKNLSWKPYNFDFDHTHFEYLVCLFSTNLNKEKKKNLAHQTALHSNFQNQMCFGGFFPSYPQDCDDSRE